MDERTFQAWHAGLAALAAGAGALSDALPECPIEDLLGLKHDVEEIRDLVYGLWFQIDRHLDRALKEQRLA
jgi:hypothetical protein